MQQRPQSLSMEQRDAWYFPEGIIEFDDTNFGEPGNGGKRGRGTSKTKVTAALSKDRDGRPKHLKMLAAADLKGKTIGAFARGAIAEKSIIETDAFAGCRKPLREKFNHRRQVYDADSQMPVRLHTIISNAKAFVQGTFHGLDELHLQRYPDEF